MTRVSGSIRRPIFKRKSLFGIRAHKYCWIECVAVCLQNKTKDTNIAITNEKILEAANKRRKLLVAFGKKNEKDPVKQEATNGHRGMIQADLFESSTVVLNLN